MTDNSLNNLIDKIIIKFDKYNQNSLEQLLQKISERTSGFVDGMDDKKLLHELDKLLRQEHKYLTANSAGYWYSFTEKGQLAQQTGGHFAYIDKIKAKEFTELKRQERKDKADELDLKIKTWQVKTKYVPYLVSIFALTVSIASYFKPEKKPIDLLPMQRQIQQLQDHVKSLDSLIQSDSLLKKRK